MSRFPQQLEPSDPLLADVYRDVCSVMDRPSPTNFFTAMSVRPDLAAATWDLVKLVLKQGQLPPFVTRLVVAAISVQAGCQYCAVTYARALEAMGMEKDMVESSLTNLDDMAISDLHRGIISFALKAATDPNSIEDADVGALRELGLSDEELVEVAIVVALTKLINTWAAATAISIDPLN